MFAKLLKHEWKATRGLLGVFTLAALIAGGIGALALRFIASYTDGMLNGTINEQNIEKAQIESLAVGGLGTLLFFVMLALVAYYLGTQIVLLYRFYKNKFTDEGYLTFTLPVKTHQILAASWLNMLIWLVISTLVVLICVAMMVLTATAGIKIPGVDIWGDALNFYTTNYTDSVASLGEFVALSVGSGLLEWIITPLIAMTCITIGAVGAKKHKILLAIAVYYGYSMVSGIISTVVTTVVSITGFQSGASSVINMSVVCAMLIQAMLALICWFLTNYLINRKLNLP